jgi:hypothetical protein
MPQGSPLVPDIQGYRFLNWGNAMKIAVYVAALCSMLLFNSPVLAACVQGDLTGVWRIYGMEAFSYQGHSQSTTHCKVVVENTGAFNTGSSWCKDIEEGATVSVQGSLSVNSACRVSGQIDLDGFITTITEARLNASRRMRYTLNLPLRLGILHKLSKNRHCQALG